MYGSKGRSGIGNAYIGDDFSGHTWQDISGLSPNGRQYMSEVTGQPRNLSGADYWHMRKDLPDKLSCAEIITADSYATPSYYHAKKQEKVAQTSVSSVANEEFSAEQCNATEDVVNAVLDANFTDEIVVDIAEVNTDNRDKLAERMIGLLVLIITATVVWQLAV